MASWPSSPVMVLPGAWCPPPTVTAVPRLGMWRPLPLSSGEARLRGAGSRSPVTAAPPNQEKSVSGSGLTVGHSDEPLPRRVNPTPDYVVRTIESGTDRLLTEPQEFTVF